MAKWKIALLALLGVLLLWFAGCADYYLPHTRKVVLTGTEIKRVEPKKDDPTVRDVRYLQARDVEDGESYVFKNEDTRWAWPPYLKFDAAEISSEAAKILHDQPDAVVLVKYYGYRSTVLELYPNVLSLRVVEPSYVHIPIFNILFVVGTLALFGLAFFKIRRWRSKKDAPAEPPPPADA